MPLYEYQCSSCGRRFERIQKFADPPVEVCPFCGGPVQKLVSSPAFHLKGSGWYATDYARKSESSSGGSGDTKDAKDAPAAAASKDGAADAKPAGKDAGSKDAPAPSTPSSPKNS